MRFTDPIYLLLLPVLLGGVWWSRRRLLGMSRERKRLVLLLRSLIMLLLVLALAGWQAVRENRGVCTLFLLDVSESVPEKGRKKAEAYIREALQSIGREDKAGLIVFGRDALIEMAPTLTHTLNPIYSAPDRQGTDLSAAIRLATALFPDAHARRIVLLSDGNETEGDALQAAAVAVTEKIEIDTVQLASAAPESEVLVTEVSTPSEVKIGEPFNLRVVIESNKPASGTLRIDRDGVPLKWVPVELSPGKNVVVVSLQSEKAGFYRYRAVLEAMPDEDPRNNLGRGFVVVRGKPRVLLAEGKPDPSRALARALSKHDIQVVTATPDCFPSRADEFQNYDSIIFHDFPAYALSPQQMLTIQSAVRDTGIGFAMIGGEESFLPGGYYETPIADLLPVDLEVRQRRVFPAATVVIVIDISGSMEVPEGGIPKVQLAGHAAIETLKMLRPNDRFGVIVSGTGVDWLTPIQPAANKERAIEQIARIYAGGGGIYVRPSLQEAARALLSQNTRVKHLILLADGNDCDEQEGCLEIAHQLYAQGATITAVALGRGVDVPFLQQLARAGKGNFYLTERARDLPRLFTADVSLMTRSAIEEGAFIPKVAAGEELLQGLDWSQVPALLAYNLTSDRPLARTIMRTHKDDPLLAVWQYGLGTTLAFTSDAKPKWAQRWVPWSQFDAFWTQVLRSTLRKTGKLDYSLTTRREGSHAVVEMQAFDPAGNPLNFLQPELKVTYPDGKSHTLILQQEAPGRYKGKFALRDIGDYLLTLTQRQPDGTVRVSTTGFALPYPPEYRFTRANTALLKRLADLTGGRFNPAPNQVFRPSTRPGVSVSDLWTLCLWIALCLFLLDITVRRVVLPLGEAGQLLANLWARWRAGRARRPAPEVQVSAHLLSVKGRVRAQTKAAEGGQQAASGITASTEQATARSRKPPIPDLTLHRPPSERGAPPPSPTAPSSEAPSETTSRLLEIKRRKRS